MARTRSGTGGRGGLRTLALVAAVLIALASTAAVVLSDDPQTLRLAVVGALWAFVLAAFAAPRRREARPRPRPPAAALELRRTYEIELEKEVAARREYELQLEVYLRRELERGLAEDVAALRDEVGRMHGEMIDRLDGELRMERIETTRLIGDSLRALQDEARRVGIGRPGPAEYPAADLDYPAPRAAPAGDFQGGTRRRRSSTARPAVNASTGGPPAHRTRRTGPGPGLPAGRRTGTGCGVPAGPGPAPPPAGPAAQPGPVRASATVVPAPRAESAHAGRIARTGVVIAPGTTARTTR